MALKRPLPYLQCAAGEMVPGRNRQMADRRSVSEHVKHRHHIVVAVQRLVIARIVLNRAAAAPAVVSHAAATAAAAAAVAAASLLGEGRVRSWFADRHEERDRSPCAKNTRTEADFDELSLGLSRAWLGKQSVSIR
jgi:hypothetical protein